MDKRCPAGYDELELDTLGTEKRRCSSLNS